jgi:hypothetical protein
MVPSIVIAAVDRKPIAVSHKRQLKLNFNNADIDLPVRIPKKIVREYF